MGKNSEIKDIRKQVRNVVQEVLPTVLTDEFGRALHDKLLKEQNTGIDRIETFCRTNLNAQDERARKILGFIVNEVKVGISNDLTDMRIELIAQRELLCEKVGLIENLEQLLNDKKLEVQLRLNKQAEAAQQVAIKADQAKAEMEKIATDEAANQEAPDVSIEQEPAQETVQTEGV